MWPGLHQPQLLTNPRPQSQGGRPCMTIIVLTVLGAETWNFRGWVVASLSPDAAGPTMVMGLLYFSLEPVAHPDFIYCSQKLSRTWFSRLTTIHLSNKTPFLSNQPELASVACNSDSWLKVKHLEWCLP